MAAPPSREHTLRSLVPSAPRAWQPCRRHRGQPLTNADGQVSKVGSTVVGSMFGEGIARGTVPFEKGDGVNVCKSTGRRTEATIKCWKATEPWIENLKLARLQPGWQQRVHALGGVWLAALQDY